MGFNVSPFLFYSLLNDFTLSKLKYYSPRFSLNTPFNSAQYFSVMRGHSLAQRFPLAQSCIQMKHHDLPLICTWEYFFVSVLYFYPLPFCREYIPKLYRIVVWRVPHLTILYLSSNFSAYSILLGYASHPIIYFLYREVFRTL